MPPDTAARREPIVLRLATPDELFDGPPPGRRVPASTPDARADWDAIGAALGEPGTLRLLRLLHAHPSAPSLIIRLGAADDAIQTRLKTWAAAQIAANAEQVRVARTAGARASAACLIVLAGALAASWALQHEPVLGPPGPFRTLIAEALVIAGWVVMWRPLEMLLFDPVRPRRENRLLRRLMDMPWQVHADPGSDTGDLPPLRPHPPHSPATASR
jgi:hypothetical protein